MNKETINKSYKDLLQQEAYLKLIENHILTLKKGILIQEKILLNEIEQFKRGL